MKLILFAHNPHHHAFTGNAGQEAGAVALAGRYEKQKAGKLAVIHSSQRFNTYTTTAQKIHGRFVTAGFSRRRPLAICWAQRCGALKVELLHVTWTFAFANACNLCRRHEQRTGLPCI